MINRNNEYVTELHATMLRCAIENEAA
jgi:hypothetical protein